MRSSIGFTDPRTDEAQLLWPERFDRTAVEALKINLGSYAAAGQLQQRPAPRGGGMFRRDWFEVVAAAPASDGGVRGWDLAASTGDRAAYTAGVRLTRNRGIYYVEDVRRFRGSAHTVETALVNCARQDGQHIRISIPQDPGQAGKAQAQYLIGRLAGFNARASTESGDKAARAEPVSAQAEAGNIKLVRGDWNDAFLEELAQFPNGAFKDQVDALSRAFDALQNIQSGRRVKIKGT